MAKRGRKPGQQKGYFYEEQENAIILYLYSDDNHFRSKLYNKTLKPAFTKMIESIIRRYKLYVPDEEFNETFNDTLSYLMTKINNFDPSKGHKAYSYCGTVCKNYLKSKCSKYIKKQTKNSSYEEMASELNNIGYMPEDDKSEFASIIISKMISELKDELEMNSQLTANEIKVGKALLFLFENWEKVLYEGSNKLQKSTILYFLREETNLTTKDLRLNMKPYKIIYKALKNKTFSK